MKRTPDEPQKIASKLSLFVTIFVILIFWGIFHLVFPQNSQFTIPFAAILFAGLLSGVFSFIVANYLVRNYLAEKIRLIFKTIRTTKLPQSGDKAFSKSSLDKVNQEVLKWSQDKTHEIEELKKMAEYRREFLGNITHELKTPVFNVQGYIMTLLEGAMEDPEINRQYLIRAEKNLDRIVMIIDDLMKISALESGKLKLEISRFDIVELACEAMDLISDKAKAKNMSLSLLHPYDYSYPVKADRERIKDVLINLIDNAIKYGNANGRIRISFYIMDTHVLTEVTDDGPGIEAVDLSRIFERFYRADKARSRTEDSSGGTGLGLAIVKHIIEAHNERINVRSTPGIGTTFAFTLKKGELD